MEEVKVQVEVDPVCGMKVEPTHAAGTSERDGKLYYFCSKSCKETFDKQTISTNQAGNEAHSCCGIK